MHIDIPVVGVAEADTQVYLDMVIVVVGSLGPMERVARFELVGIVVENAGMDIDTVVVVVHERVVVAGVVAGMRTVDGVEAEAFQVVDRYSGVVRNKGIARMADSVPLYLYISVKFQSNIQEHRKKTHMYRESGERWLQHDISTLPNQAISDAITTQSHDHPIYILGLVDVISELSYVPTTTAEFSRLSISSK